MDIPTPEATRELVAQVAKSSKKKYALVLAGGGAVLVGGAYAAHYVIKKREAARQVAAADVPECVTSFDESLRAYVEAGRSGDLNADILDQLITDLDAVKEFTADGNEVLISLDSLIPLFDMVIAHTGRLADAYDVVLGDLDVPDSEDDVVVSLSRHLHAQRSILSRAA